MVDRSKCIPEVFRRLVRKGMGKVDGGIKVDTTILSNSMGAKAIN